MKFLWHLDILFEQNNKTKLISELSAVIIDVFVDVLVIHR